ncbi:transcription initiation factor TFIID subunit 4-like [Setaria italica]|uniref:transcription initiation factor TFIID subunit 4-like n=1 Tax=Setaria italica TaxID=4555 RepID=UPI000350E456|nr:transcription initiation factor TFIID subunit 4-like [Setaria italica]
MDPARSAPRGSSEPTPAVAQEPAQGALQESARGAPRKSAEAAFAVAPETGGQRSGDKRPLPDAPGSASGPEAKRARHPCSSGIAAPRGLIVQLAPKKALRVSSSSVGWTAVPLAASSGVPERRPQGPQVGEVIDLDADEVEGMTAMGGGSDVPGAAAGSVVAATEEGASASAAVAEEAAVTETGTSAPEVPVEVTPAAEAEEPARGTPAGTGESPSVVAAEGEVTAGVLVPRPMSEAAGPSGSPRLQSGEI